MNRTMGPVSNNKPEQNLKSNPIMNYKRLWAAIIIGILLILPSQYAKAEPIKLNMVFVPASEKGDDNDYVNLIKIIEKLFLHYPN